MTAVRGFKSGTITLGLLTAALLLAADQGAKRWALLNLQPGKPVAVIPGWLKFDLTVNTGASFSIFTGQNRLLTVLAAAVLAAIFALLIAFRGSPAIGVGLGAVLGGAAGNIIDRLRLHAVVDFLKTPLWPADFNLADVAIRAGALTVVLAMLLSWRRQPRR
jgi:signal peptidase II